MNHWVDALNIPIVVAVVSPLVIRALGASARIVELAIRRDKVLRVEPRPFSTGGAWVLAMPSPISASDIAGISRVDLRDVHDWLVENKQAFTWGPRHHALLLSNPLKTEIRVEDAIVHIDERDAGPVGAMVKSPPAGARIATLVGFDLTSGGDGRAVEVVEDCGIQWTPRPYFEAHDIHLDPGDSTPLTVYSHTMSADTVHWRIRFTVSVKNTTHHVYYPPLDQQAFVTSEVAETTQYWMTGVVTEGTRPWLRPAMKEDLPAGVHMIEH